jgi:hypothetical protein
MFALYLQYHGLLSQRSSDIGEEWSLVENDGERGGQARGEANDRGERSAARKNKKTEIVHVLSCPA